MAAPRPALSVRAYVDELGGGAAGTRRLSLIRAGLDPNAKLPASGTEDYRRYRSSRRSVERYLRGEAGAGGQTRRASTSSLETQRPKVRAAATSLRVDRMARRGARARISAEIRVSEDRRQRIIPAGGPGLYLTAQEIGPALAALRRGDAAAAESRFIRAFLRRYMAGAGALDEDKEPDEAELGGMEIGDVKWIRVWPDGEEEPG